MLKKENRLKNPKAFAYIYNNGISTANKDFVLYITKKEKEENCPIRVGFVVSKKVHKRAVVRNKIKRRLREHIRLLIKENSSILSSFENMIFIARANSINLTNDEIKNSIFNLLDNIAKKFIQIH